MAELVVRVECCAVCVALFVAAIHDLRTRTIPNACVAAVAFARLCAVAALSATGADPVLLLAESLLGAAAVGTPLVLSAHLVGGIGGGDVKLLTALGLCFGWQRGVALVVLSCALTVLVGCCGYFARRRRAHEASLMSTTVPMAPQIAFAVLALLAAFQV